MTEEIKEIFYKLKSDDYYEEHYQQSVYYERDLKKLENYITNLQKENEDYKSRNEKAIEYIKNRSFDEVSIGPFDNDFNCKENLLNILQGGDE